MYGAVFVSGVVRRPSLLTHDWRCPRLLAATLRGGAALWWQQAGGKHAAFIWVSQVLPAHSRARVSKAGRGRNALALAAPAGIVGEDSAVGPRAPPLLLKAFNVPLPLPPCALLFPEGHSRCNLRYDWSAALNSGSEMTPSPSRSTARIISSRV